MKYAMIGIVAILLGWLPIPLHGAHESLSRADLGSLVCADPPGTVKPKTVQQEVCRKAWKTVQSRGASINRLIHEVCSLMMLKEGDHRGIQCVETAIEGVAHMRRSELLAGQFKPGEREKNPVWAHRSDRAWAETLKDMIRGIPPHCDNNTPVIFNYFACIVNEVLNAPHRLKVQA